MPALRRIVPSLWFDDQAEVAARFYTGIFPDSRNGGPHFQFSPAISFEVNCATREEIDFYWEKLSQSVHA